MTDPRRELAELVADVRAVAEANLAQGIVDESVLERIVVEASAPSPASVSGLEGVRAELGDCTRCPLHSGRRNIVFGVGDPSADLMVVGDAPGFHEDRTGEPFVEETGQMLDRMLVHVLGLRREQVYIANVIKCRPNDRSPTAAEISTCLPFLHQQVLAIQPKLILVLGGVALKSLVDTPAKITQVRGEWLEFKSIPVMPTFHPKYLLMQPQQKRLTFQDLKAVRARYDHLGGKRA